MPDPKRDCPNCGQRIHPLDLSDLYRGRKLNCAHCGRGLLIRAEWWAAVPLGLLAWWGLIQLGQAVDLPIWLETTLAGLLAWAVMLLVNRGLVIEGAPWVKLSAHDQPWAPGRWMPGFKQD